MNLGLIKSGLQLISGFGVGLVIDEGLKKIKPKNLVGFKKVAAKLGGYVISAMVIDKATTYVGEEWDKAAEDLKKLVQPVVITEEKVEETTEES